MNQRIVSVVASLLVCIGCDAGGLIIVETKDAGQDAPVDAEFDNDAAVVQIVDAACGNGNPGTGTCKDAAECTNDACGYSTCNLGHCVYHPYDAGALAPCGLSVCAMDIDCAGEEKCSAEWCLSDKDAAAHTCVPKTNDQKAK